MHQLTTSLLDHIRRSCRVSIGECAWTDVTNGSVLACVQVRSADGAEQWTGWAENRYDAACELAIRVGMELDDG